MSGTLDLAEWNASRNRDISRAVHEDAAARRYVSTAAYAY